MQWSALINQFADSLYAANHSEHTIRAYRTDIRQLLRWFDEEMVEPPPIQEVSDSDLERFMGSQRQAGLASQTLKRRVASIRRFFRWAHDRGIMEENPAAGLSSPRSHYLPEYCPTPEEVSAILRRCRHRLTWAIMGTLYYTGLRIGELCGLRLSDVQLDRGLLVVREGKGGKSRHLPLSPPAKEILTTYREEIRPDVDSELFFATGSGALSPGYAGKLIRRERRRQGIKQPLTAHSFRHAFATALYEQGVDLKKLQSLLGHSNLNTLQIYVHLSRDSLAEAVNRLE